MEEKKLQKARNEKERKEICMETFNLSFSDFIGKNVTLSDEGEYYCGVYISGRFYSGKFGGSFYESNGIYFKVDDNMIRIDVKTKITFSE